MHIYLMAELTNSSPMDTVKQSQSIEEKWHTFLTWLFNANLCMLPIPLIRKLIQGFTSK